MKALVVSSKPWTQSNRGIDILTEALIDKGFDVDHLVFPIYGSYQIKREKSTYSSRLHQIFATRTMLPYDEDTMYFFPKTLMNVIRIMHLKSVSMINFESYDLIVLESGKPVMLVDLIPKNVVLIYRQSDPVWMMYRNKYLLEYENLTIKRSNLVLVVREVFRNYIYKDFCRKTYVWVNGFNIPDNYLDINPYKKNTKNGVYLGFSPIDYETLRRIAKENCDCQFHIIGTKPWGFAKLRLQGIKNIHFYGYLNPYHYIRYIKYASFSFVPYLLSKNMFKFVGLNSKFLMAMYFNLPIVSYKVGVMSEFNGLPVLFADSIEDFSRKISYAKNLQNVHYNINYNYFSREGRKTELMHILRDKLGV